MKNGIPEIGDSVTVYGYDATVVRIYPLGTIDVERADGKRIRMTGLYRAGWPTKTISRKESER
jgi:hypothetical protein